MTQGVVIFGQHRPGPQPDLALHILVEICISDASAPVLANAHYVDQQAQTRVGEIADLAVVVGGTYRTSMTARTGLSSAALNTVLIHDIDLGILHAHA